MSTLFQKLPRELCTLILEEVSHKKDLSSVARTCKDLHGSAQRLLFGEIRFNWRVPPLERIILLLRSISENPNIVNLIRDVVMQDWEICAFFNKPAIRKPQRDWSSLMEQYRPTIEWCQDLVKASGFPPKMEEKLVSYLGLGDEYAYATVLLTQLHELRSLRLDFSSSSNAISPGKCFIILEKVDYGSNAPHLNIAALAISPRQLEPWLHLPSLKTLEIWIPDIQDISQAHGPRGAAISAPVSGALEMLFICRSFASADKIAALLNGLPMIKSLHVGMLQGCHTIGESFQNPQPLVDAIQAKGERLEALSISMEILEGCVAESHLPVIPEVIAEAFKGLLLNLPHLKSVEIPIDFLLGPRESGYKLKEVLPPGIELLHIRPDFQYLGNFKQYSDALILSVDEFTLEMGAVSNLRQISFHGPSCAIHCVEQTSLTDVAHFRRKHKRTQANCAALGFDFICHGPFWVPGNLIMAGKSSILLSTPVDVFTTTWPYKRTWVPYLG